MKVFKKKIYNDLDPDLVRLKFMNKTNVLINSFVNEDLKTFLRKFFGFFIKRGRKSFAIKFFDYLYINFKKTVKLNPHGMMFKIIKSLMPSFIIGLKTFKGRKFYIPIMVRGNKKNVLVIDWLVRLFIGFSNTWGMKKEDIFKSLMDSFYYRGKAMSIKKEQYTRALENKYNLRKVHYQRHIIRNVSKEEGKLLKKKIAKRDFNLVTANLRWRWKLFYLNKKKDILNWKLYYLKQRKLSMSSNLKKKLIK